MQGRVYGPHNFADLAVFYKVATLVEHLLTGVVLDSALGPPSWDSGVYTGVHWDVHLGPCKGAHNCFRDVEISIICPAFLAIELISAFGTPWQARPARF